MLRSLGSGELFVFRGNVSRREPGPPLAGWSSSISMAARMYSMTTKISICLIAESSHRRVESVTTWPCKRDLSFKRM